MRNSSARKPDSINLALAVHGNEEGAVEALVCRYQDQLIAYVTRLLQNSFDAQEVTQDTFLRAYRALTTQYDEVKCRNLALRPWLFAIARNLAWNRARARRLAAKEVSLDASDNHLFVSEQGERELLSREESGLLGKAIQRLSPVHRDVILLRFMAEIPYAEIAVVLKTSEASARGKVFRALRQLRAVLEEKENDDAL